MLNSEAVRLSSCILGVWLLLPSACKVNPPEGGGDKGPDAGLSNLRTPRVNAPDRTPYGYVAIRGQADGASRVVIKDADSQAAQVSPLLPGGDFCVDTTLTSGAKSDFLVYGVAEDGNISMPAELTVTHDEGAPPPAEPSCNTGSECAATETCSNEIDDDCDGYRDECDSQCNGCDDDNLEPNDTPFSVPMVPPDTYPGLKICPCREDWYSFLVGEGGRIHATATFQHSEIDIDMKLYEAAIAEMHMDTPVEGGTSVTITNSEAIDFVSPSGGLYYLRVFSPRTDDQGTYSLRIY